MESLAFWRSVDREGNKVLVLARIGGRSVPLAQWFTTR
jgi:hypothetical protein